MKLIFSTFIVFIVLLSTLGGIVGCSDNDEDVYTLVCESVFPDGHVISEQGQRIIDEIESRSDGRIEVTYHTGASVVPASEALDALGNGTLDLLVSHGGYYSGTLAIMDVLYIPGAFKSHDDFNDIMLNKGLLQLHDEAYQDKFNAKVLGYCFPVEVQDIYTSDKAINSWDDLDGLKIRTAGSLSAIYLGYAGATATPVSTADIYHAFDTGIVDGLFLQISGIQAYGLAELVKYVTKGVNFQVGAAAAYVNLDTWDDLPSDLQDIISDVCEEMTYTFTDEIKVSEVTLFDEISSENDWNIIELSTSEADVFYEKAIPLWDELDNLLEDQGEADLGTQQRQIIEEYYQ